MKITIIDEVPGRKEKDLSIEIPDAGEIATEIGKDDIPKNVSVRLETFSEYRGYTRHFINKEKELCFPSVALSSKTHATYPHLKFLWIEGRKEWIGLKHSYNCLMGLDEEIEADGPYRLNERAASLIKRAYRSNIPLENVLHTPPSELERASRRKGA
jgi:hypothetical protein